MLISNEKNSFTIGAFACDNYGCNANRVKILGILFGKMFARDFDGSNLHLVGHSLGAHILGFMAQYMKGQGKLVALFVGKKQMAFFG